MIEYIQAEQASLAIFGNSKGQHTLADYDIYKGIPQVTVFNWYSHEVFKRIEVHKQHQGLLILQSCMLCLCLSQGVAIINKPLFVP